MSKNLVTGGSGFLGSHLVEALVARGEKVRVLVRSTSKVDYLKSLKVDLIYGDLNNIQSLRKAIQNSIARRSKRPFFEESYLHLH